MQNVACVAAALLLSSAFAAKAETQLTSRASRNDAGVAVIGATSGASSDATRSTPSPAPSFRGDAPATPSDWTPYWSEDLADDLRSTADVARADVPEPSLKSLLVFGLIGLATIRRHTRRHPAH